MSSVDGYISSLSILKEAGTSIIVTRTREPHEVSAAVRDYVVGANKHYHNINDPERLAYGNWNALDGLTFETETDLQFNTASQFKTKEKPQKKTCITGVREVTKALQLFAGKIPPEEARLLKIPDEIPIGVYDMVWPQGAFEKEVARSALLYLAEEFTYVTKCLVLIVPQHVNVPEELNDFCVFLDFDPPSPEERKELIVDVLKQFKAKHTDNLEKIITASAGMTAFELKSCLSIAIKELLVAGEKATVDALATKVMDKKIEIINRTGMLEFLPIGDIEQIGGLQNIKTYFADCAKCYSEEAEADGVDTPKGVGVFGPPGAGKTALARAAGDILKKPVLRFDVSKILKKYVGESEGMARTVFAIIRSIGECVIFIDEADKVFSGASDENGSGGAQRRIMGMLLSFMETSKGVFWIIAGNAAEKIPAEMLRKQRLDELFSVDLPTPSERRAVINIHLKKRKKDPSTILDLEIAVTKSRGFVSAEIEAAVKEAVKSSFVHKREMNGALIAEQFDNMKPIAKAFAKQFNAMRDFATYIARPASAKEEEEGLEPISMSSYKDSSKRKSRTSRIKTDKD